MRDKNRNRRSIGALAVVCVVLQLAVAPHIGLGVGRANVALAFAGLVALSVGGRTGVLAGFLAGLFFDLCTTGPIGLMALLLTVFSFILGSEERNRMSDEPTGSFVLFAGGSFAVVAAYHLAMLLVGEATSLIDALVMRTLPTYGLTLLAFVAIGYVSSRGGSSGSLGRSGSSGLGSGLGRHARGGSVHLGRS